LVAGDELNTIESGFSEVKWIKSRNLSKVSPAVGNQLAPVRIEAGALGNNRPTSDIVCSPNQLIGAAGIGGKVKALFNWRAGYLPALSILDLNGVSRVPLNAIDTTYFTIEMGSTTSTFVHNVLIQIPSVHSKVSLV